MATLLSEHFRGLRVFRGSIHQPGILCRGVHSRFSVSARRGPRIQCVTRQSHVTRRIVLTHHKLSHRSQRNLGLSDKDAPKLNPMTEVGSGVVRDKYKALLNKIIDQLNTFFSSDTTDGDQLAYATTLLEKTLESQILQKQSASNTKEQFANSPDITNEILTAIIDSMDAQTELSTRALNSAAIREGLKIILLNQLGLYEKLKSRAIGA